MFNGSALFFFVFATLTLQLSSFYTAINWAGTAVFHRERKANKQTFDRRQWTLVSLLSVCTALNTLVGRANIAVPTTFDQAC